MRRCPRSRRAGQPKALTAIACSKCSPACTADERPALRLPLHRLRHFELTNVPAWRSQRAQQGWQGGRISCLSLTRIKTVATAAAAKRNATTRRNGAAQASTSAGSQSHQEAGPINGQRLTPLGPASILQPTVRSRVVNAPPGDNRTQRGCWTLGIFPVSARDINALVRADN